MKFKYFVHFMVCSFIHLPDAGVAGRVWRERDDHSRQCPSRWTRASQASIGHLKNGLKKISLKEVKMGLF